MKMTIGRITRTAMLAVAFMLCATSAWAAPTATAVWEGDFEQSKNGYAITLPSGMTYSKGTTGNIVISSSAKTGAVIELNESTDWKVSVLIKYSHLYAVSGKKVSLATVKDSAGNVIGIRSTANGALTTTGFHNGGDSGYDFVNGQRAQSGSGYLLFSYNPNDGTFAYTGRTINSLSGGKNGTLRWGGKYIDSLSIGGPVVSGKTEAWAGVVIEKVALFVGEAYTNENIADYAFPSQTRWHDTDTYAYRGASSGSYFHLSNLEPVDCFDVLEGDTITLDASTDSYFWKKFASNQVATYYKAPGCALFYDKTGYTAQADCTFGPLSFGGLYVTSEQTAGDTPTYYSIIGKGERNTELGDPTGKTETYFVFDKSFTIRRSGDKTVNTKLYGVVNVSVESGMTFDLNSAPYSSGHASIKSVLTTAGTTAPVLKMSGGGKFKVYELDASTGTLDFSGVTATPFIDGSLTVTKDTKLVLPAGIAEGDSYVICSGTLTAPTAIIKTTVQVGNGSPFMGYVTYNAETKSVSYSTTAPAYTCTVDGTSSTWSADGLTAEDFAVANVTFTGSGTVEFDADAASITVGAGVTVIASSPSLSATVMLSDATSVLRMGTTGTLSGGISGSGVLEIADSVTTTVPSSVTLSHTGGTTIGDNAKLTAPYASTAWGYSVTGGNTARVVLTGTSNVTSAAKSGFQSSSTWTGTVELGSFYIANLFLTHYGNASSTVCANGTSTYFPSDGWNDSNNTTAQNVKAFEIGAGGLSMPVNDNYNKISKKRFLFPCKLTGTGTFTLGLNAYAANEYNYVVFTGDVSEFQGVFSTGTGNGARPPACVVFAATGTSYPTLSSETLTRFASDNGSFHFLSGKTVTFNANSTWTAKGGYYVDGTLTINGPLTCSGDMTIQGDVTIASSSTSTVGGVLTVKSGAELTIDGALTLSKDQNSRFTVAVVETGGKISINSSGEILVNGSKAYGRFEIYGDLLVGDGGKFESLADMQIYDGGAAYVLGGGSLWLYYGMMDGENGNAGMITVPSVARLKTRRYTGSNIQYTKVKNTETGKVIFKPTNSSVTSESIGDFTDYVVIGSGSVEIDISSPSLTLPTGTTDSLTLFATTTELDLTKFSVTGNNDYYLQQNAKDAESNPGALTLQLHAAKDSAGVYYDDVAEAFDAIVEDPTLTVTILNGTEASYVETLASKGLGRNGTQVFPLVAERIALDGSVIAQYPTAQAAVEADSGDSIVAIYETSTVTARVAPFYIKPVGISLDDITVNCVYAGVTYDEFTDMSGYGGNFVGVYAVQRHASPATFAWKSSSEEGNWSDVENWTSEDGDVLYAPNNANYTIVFESDATIDINDMPNISAAKIVVDAQVTLNADGGKSLAISVGTAGVVLASSSASITAKYHATFADDNVVKTTVEGRYVRVHWSGDWKIYDLASSAATVYDAEDNVVNGYNSLADAVAAAADGQKVKLFANSSDTVTVNDKSITFIEDSYTFTGSFTGNGTVIMTELPKAISTSSLWAAGWTGTLWLKGVTFPVIESGADAGKSVVNPSTLGNATSTLRLTGCEGGFSDYYQYDDSKHKFPGTVDLVDGDTKPAFKVTSSWPGFGKTVFAKLTGTGTLTAGTTAKSGHYYQILDASEFAGTITIPSDTAQFRVGIGTVDAASDNGSSISARTLTIQTGAEVTIAAGKTWTAPAGFTIDGTLNVNGNLVSSANLVSGSGTVVFTGKLPPSGDADNAWWKNAAWTGKVEIKSYAHPYDTTVDFGIIVLNKYGNSNSTVALNGVTSTMFAVNNNKDYPPVALKEIEIGEGGWTDIADGSFGADMLYTANLTGHGLITVKTGGNGTVKFIGNHTFDGSVAFGDSTGKQVAFMRTAEDEIPAATAKAIVVAEGVEMSVASGKTWTADGGFVIKGTLNVEGALASSAATAVSGTGTVVFDGKFPSPTGDAWWENDAWDGTVWLKNQEVAGFDGTTCGNEGSTVRFTGVTGYLHTSSYGGSTYVHTVPLELVDDGDTVAFTYNNGYGGCLVRLNTLKGTGTLKTQDSGAGEHIYIVDASDFAGVFNLTAKSVYVGGSTPDYSDSTGMSGKLEIRDGTTLTVPSGKTWTANGGFVVNGTLNVNGTLASSHASKAVSGSGKVVFTGRLPSPTGDAWWKNDAWTGKVELKNYDHPYDTTVDYGIIVLNNYGNMNSTVALNGVTSTMFAVSGNSNYPPVTLKEIEIGEGGWTDIADGSFGADMLYTANLTGHGLITVKTGGNGTVKFIGNHTFDGSVAFGDSTGKRVAFMKTSSDELPPTVTAKSIIVAGGLDMSITSGKTWTAAGGIKIDGTLTVLTLQKDAATPGSTISNGKISAYKDGDGIGSTDDEATSKTIYASVTPIAISDNQASQGAVTVIGAQSITGTGGAYMSSLTIKDGATLTYDPVITPLRVEAAPVFNGTGKLKLAARYKDVTCGKFHLVTYPSKSFNEYSEEALKALVDSSSFNNATYTVSEVEVALDTNPRIVSDASKSSYWQLVLMVGDYDTNAKDVSIAQFGDSITEGIWRDGYRGTPNYRIPLMHLLEAYGYRPEARGYREVGSMDANGILADDNYKWHTGISAQRIYTGGSSLRAGFMESIEAHLEQVGVTDIITLKIGTNDAIGGESADNMFEGWSNLVWKIVRMRPTSKIVVCTPVTIRSGEGKAPGLRSKIADYINLTYAEGGFPDGQVTMVNGFAAVTDDANYYLGDKVHPNWNGHLQLANAWLPAVTNAIESMNGTRAAAAYTAQTLASASALDELAAYRAGYVKLATFTNFNAKVSAWGENPYVSVNDTYKDMPMRRVAYFVARKTKASPDTRYVWVDMDADETAGNTLAAFGMPTNAAVNGVVNNLHIYSNSSAIENVAPTVSGVKGTLMRTEKGVSGAAGISAADAPAGVIWDNSKNLFDWNDSISAGDTWGVMGVARKFDNASPTTHRQLLNAQMLFDFNGFNVSGKNNALGIGNFAVHGQYDKANSTLTDQTLNWTFKVAMPTMDASALDSGVIEIWGKPAWGTIFSVW